jgi:hypothetical protein
MSPVTWGGIFNHKIIGVNKEWRNKFIKQITWLSVVQFITREVQITKVEGMNNSA